MADSAPVIPATSLTPEQLAQRCQRGHADAFGELVAVFQDRIFNYLWRLSGNPHDAQDLTQDTFVKAFRAIHRFDGSGSFAAWLFLIAKRTGLNHLRDHRREIATDAPEQIDHTTPDTLVQQAEEQDSIWALARRRLKPDQAEALWLRYGEQLSIAATARVMRTNQIRIRVLLHRGRAHLAILLQRRVT